MVVGGNHLLDMNSSQSLECFGEKKHTHACMERDLETLRQPSKPALPSTTMVWVWETQVHHLNKEEKVKETSFQSQLVQDGGTCKIYQICMCQCADNKHTPFHPGPQYKAKQKHTQKEVLNL